MFLGQNAFSEEAKTYTDATNTSKSTEKKIFLYFGASWCGYCSKMQSLFKDPDVVNKMDNYIVLKVDIDENPELAKKFNVKTIPDYMLIDKDEEILKRNKGYKEKSSFLNWLK
jgi:thioredoxin 1